MTFGEEPEGYWEALADNQQQADYLKAKAAARRAKAEALRGPTKVV